MISLLITIALAGLIVWLFTSVIPLPAPFPKIMLVVAIICVIFAILNAFGILQGGGHDIAVPQLR